MAEPTNADIRAWARSQGMVVADRGRLPGHVLTAYFEAQGQPSLPVAPPEATAAEAAPVETATVDTSAVPTGWGSPGPAAPAGDTTVWQAPPQAATGWDSVPEPARDTDGFAITAFVLGLLGGVLLSVVFGVLALRRIRKSGRRGRGLAIAGLVLSGVWLVGIAIAVAVAVAGSADRDDSGAVTTSGDVAIDDLRVGDCTGDLPEGEVLTLTVQPCDTAHVAEAYATFDLDGDDFPGQDQVDRFAEGGCSRELDEALPEGDETPYELYYFTPTEDGWGGGDRTVICLVAAPEGGELVGSVLDGTAVTG